MTSQTSRLLPSSGNKLLRSLIATVILTIMPFYAHSQVLTTHAGIKVNWSEGILSGVGVGRSSFDSSIARPSRETHFRSAKQNAEHRLSTAIAALWATTPLYRTIKKSPINVARQALTAFPPTVELFADGTVHASFQIPLSILDVGDAVGVHEDSNLVVLKINGNYTPSLGLIWCFLGETRSLAQTRITHHRSEQELPAFLRGGGTRYLAGSFDHEFQCVSLDDSADARAAWGSLHQQPRVYVVHSRGGTEW